MKEVCVCCRKENVSTKCYTTEFLYNIIDEVSYSDLICDTCANKLFKTINKTFYSLRRSIKK